MKKAILLSSVAVFSAVSVFAQNKITQSFNYQGTLRKNDGIPIANRLASLRLSILKDGPTSEAEYYEVRKVKTNSLGMYSIQIGSAGAEATGGVAFDQIVWQTGEKYFKLEVDPNGGSSWVDAGLSPILPVPTALFAVKGGTSGYNSWVSKPENIGKSADLYFKFLKNDNAVNSLDLKDLSSKSEIEGILTIENGKGTVVQSTIVKLNKNIFDDAARKATLDGLNGEINDATTKALQDAIKNTVTGDGKDNLGIGKALSMADNTTFISISGGEKAVLNPTKIVVDLAKLNTAIATALASNPAKKAAQDAVGIENKIDKTSIASNIAAATDNNQVVGAKAVKDGLDAKVDKTSISDLSGTALNNTQVAGAKATKDALDAKLNLTGGTLTGALNLGTNKATSSFVPAAADDLTNKKYVDDLNTANTATVAGKIDKTAADNAYVAKTSISDLSGTVLNNTQVAGAKATKDALDAKLNLTGGTLTGALNLGTNKATSSSVPAAADDLTNKKYVDDLNTANTTATAANTAAVAGKIDKTAIASNIAAATDNNQVAGAKATKDALDGKLNLTGGTLTGALNLGTNKATSSFVPAAADDLTNKKYVDDLNTANTAAVAGKIDKTAIASNIAAATDNNQVAGAKAVKDGLDAKVDKTSISDLSGTALNNTQVAAAKATKDALDGKLNLTGGTLTGALNLGTNKATSSFVPAAADDLTNKKYVDDLNTANTTATAANTAAVADKIDKTAIASNIATATDNNQVAGAKAVKDGLDAKIDKTSISDLSGTALNNTQVAGAKAVKDALDAKLNLTGGTLTGALNLGTNKATSSFVPAAADDLTNKKYVDDLNTANTAAVAGKIDKTAIASNIAAATDNNQVAGAKAVKDGLDAKLNLTGGTLTGALNLGANKATSSFVPAAADDLTNKKYVDDATAANTAVVAGKIDKTAADNAYVAKTSISDLSGTALNNTQVAGAKATKDALDAKLNLTGGTLTGALNFGANKATSSFVPAAAEDLTNKKYVDDLNTANTTATAANTAAVAGKIDKTAIASNIAAATDNNQVAGAKATKDGLDAKVDKTSISDLSGTALNNTQVAGAKATKDALDAKLNLTGGTLTGALNLGANKATSSFVPAAADDLTNKKYVDDLNTANTAANTTAVAGKIDKTAIASNIATATDNNQVAGAKAVKDGLDAKIDKTSISDLSGTALNNTQVAGAKAVKDALDAKLNLTGGTLTGALNLGANKATSSFVPAAADDLTNKKYVDDLNTANTAAVAGKIDKTAIASNIAAATDNNQVAGAKATKDGLDAKVDKTSISDLSGTALNNTQVAGAKATKDALDAKLNLTGGTLTGALNLGANKATSSFVPAAADDLTNKKYVDDLNTANTAANTTAVAGKIDKTAIASNIATATDNNQVAGAKAVKDGLDAKIDKTSISDLSGTALNNTQVAGAKAVKDALDAKLNLTGGTLTGALNLGANKATSSFVPAAADDLTNKKYVDDLNTANTAAVAGKIDKTAIASNIAAATDNNQVAGAKAVKDGLDAKVDKTSISDLSGTALNNTQVAGAKSTKDALDGKLNLIGGTLTGALNLGTNKATSSFVPAAAEDLTNKKYVDDLNTANTAAVAGKIDKTAIASNIATATDNNQVAGAKAVKDGLDAKIDKTSISDLSGTALNNTQVAGAKAVKDALDAKLNLTGGTLTGALNLGANKATSSFVPAAADDLTNKKYVDDLNTANTAAVAGKIDKTAIASNIAAATDNNQVAGAKATKDALDGKLNLTGGTMSGVINMNNQTISNIPTPTANDQAVNKKYVDDNKVQVGKVAYTVPVGFVSGSNINVATNGVPTDVSKLWVYRNGVRLDQADIQVSSNQVTIVASVTAGVNIGVETQQGDIILVQWVK